MQSRKAVHIFNCHAVWRPKDISTLPGGGHSNLAATGGDSYVVAEGDRSGCPLP